MTDTTPTLIYVDGRPTAWLTADDRLYPFVAGGDGDEAGGTGAEGAGGSGSEGSGQAAAGTEGAGAEDSEGSEGGDKAAAKVDMTQADLEALIKKTTARATKAAEEKLADDAKKASLSELEKAQAEKADAEKKAADAKAAADQRAIKADAKLAAASAGVPAERVDAFLRTIDLADIDLDDQGDPDAKQLAKVVADGLTAIPEFKATKGGSGRSGGDMGGGTDTGKPKDLASAIAAAIGT